MHFFSLVSSTLVVAILIPQASAQTRTTNEDPPRTCIAADQLRIKQSEVIMQSLSGVYHGGYRTQDGLDNVLCMTDAQLERAEIRLSELTESEIDTLNRRYCVIPEDEQECPVEHDAENDPEVGYCDDVLKLWALRDTDDDGILDFRIKECGSFMANDTDADADGIDNLMDPFPLSGNAERDDPENNDSDDDGLPDHLDWTNTDWHPSFESKSARLKSLQQEIFSQYGIVLVESEGSEIAESFVEMTLDVLDVFKRLYRIHNANATAKSIIFADQYDYDPFGVLAEVSPVNGQILIFEYGIEEVVDDPDSLIAPFLVYVHEFAHVIQNAVDFPANTDDLLRFNAHTDPQRFVRLVNNLDWSIPTDGQTALTIHGGFIDHGTEPITFAEIYRDIPLNELRVTCESPGTEHSLELWEKYNVVMCYSLDSVREWHAEYIATTVLKKMYDHVSTHYPTHAEDMIHHAQMKMFTNWGGESYDYSNADGEAVNKISRQLRMGVRRIKRLAEKYVVKPYANSFGVPIAALEDIEPGPRR